MNSEPTQPAPAPAVVNTAPPPALRPIPQDLAIMLPPSVLARPDKIWALCQKYPGAPAQKIAEVAIRADALGIDPLTTPIYLISRETRTGTQWTIQSSIDVFRAIAGDDVITCHRPPEFAYDNAENLVSATVWGKKHSHGEWHQVCATALFAEYQQTDREGRLTGMWAKMPHNQLSKCAEALLLRRAAPAKLAGLYTTDEMAQAGNVIDVQVSRSAPVAMIESPAVTPADAPKAAPAPAPPAPMTEPEVITKISSRFKGTLEIFMVDCESEAIYQTTSAGLQATARGLIGQPVIITYSVTPAGGLKLEGVAAAPVAVAAAPTPWDTLMSRAHCVMEEDEFHEYSKEFGRDFDLWEAEISKRFAEKAAAKTTTTQKDTPAL